MPEQMFQPPSPLVITMGDPAGIGLELTLKAYDHYRSQGRLFPFVLLADPEHVKSLTEITLHVLDDIEAFDMNAEGLSILAVKLSSPVTPGQGNPSNGAAIISSIELAVELVQQGKASAMVTNPINKDVLYQTGFSFPGHTEFLANLCNAPQPVMMLAGGGVRVVPVTIHIPVKDIPSALTTDLIIQNGRLLNDDLKTKFGIKAPRIAVAGLNPHAGENGSIGREELEIIHPAVEALVQEGIQASGPYPSDTLFHEEARKKYDAVLCMYHDQALIPLKTLDFDGGVNVTLGLPIIRTSPDHGTAFDIAGKDIASARSLIAAMNMALNMVERQGI